MPTELVLRKRYILKLVFLEIKEEWSAGNNGSSSSSGTQQN
jgi:hypothetical protein